MIAPKKTKTDEWLDVMRQAHRLGMSTTATMMYGHVETLEERVEHMRRIRELQDETRGFRAFISWTFQRDGNRLDDVVREEDRPTSFDYLLTQAVSRIYLDNVPHIQSSWVTQGMKVGQVALGPEGIRALSPEKGHATRPLWLRDDRGERRVGCRHDPPDDDRRARPPDQSAGEDPGAARHAVPGG